MSKITSFSRKFWETVVEARGNKKNVLRDYDLIADRKRGLTCGQLAIKYEITCMQVTRILHDHQID